MGTLVKREIKKRLKDKLSDYIIKWWLKKRYVPQGVVDRLDSIFTAISQCLRSDYTPSFIYMLYEAIQKSDIKDRQKRLELDRIHQFSSELSDLNKRLKQLYKSRKRREFEFFLKEFLKLLEQANVLVKLLPEYVKDPSIILDTYNTTREIYNHLIISLYGFLNTTACLHSEYVSDYDLREKFLIPPLKH